MSIKSTAKPKFQKPGALENLILSYFPYVRMYAPPFDRPTNLGRQPYLVAKFRSSRGLFPRVANRQEMKKRWPKWKKKKKSKTLPLSLSRKTPMLVMRDVHFIFNTRPPQLYTFAACSPFSPKSLVASRKFVKSSKI